MPNERGQSSTERPQPAIYLDSSGDGRFHQGELLDNVREWVPVYSKDNEVEGTKPLLHRYSVVLTQDCDLEQDWRIRQEESGIETELRNVILCPASPADELRKSQGITNKYFKIVRQNKVDRYQYLAEFNPTSTTNMDSHPAMLVDFKSYFTVRTIELYRQHNVVTTNGLQRRARLAIPWREHLQLRFAAFQSRIGLPLDHFIPESRRKSLPSLSTNK